jgi:hypothetical protein
MDLNSYALETMIRDRLAEARAEARVAALLRQPNERSARYGIRSWFVEHGRSLVNRARKAAFAIAGAFPHDTHITKHP